MLVLFTLESVGQASQSPTLKQSSPSQTKLAQQVVKNHATSLAFETNVFGGEASYLLTTPQVNLAFMPDRVQFVVTPATDKAEQAPVSWSMRWLGGNVPHRPEAINELGDKGDYRFIDKQGSHRIGRYAELWYNNVYEHTDLRFYGRGQTDLEYDFVVKPGGQPNQIRLAMDGVKDVQVSPAGELMLSLPFGNLKKAKPYAYQTIGGEEKAVAVRYKLQPDRSVGFEVGDYDASKPLVIDPVVILWSTFIGGTTRDYNGGIWVDDLGFIYLTGTTRAGSGFPTTLANSQAPGPNYMRVFVMKLNPNGNQILWSTILDTHTGDSNGNELNVGLVVGTDNKPVVLMHTTTGTVGAAPGNVPPSYTTPGAFQPASAGSRDVYLAKLSADGSTVEWATYFGGSGEDVAVYTGSGQALGIDSNNNVYVSGSTNSADLPVSAGAFQPYYKGGDDQFMFSFSPTGSLRWSTYIGSTLADRVASMQVDPDGTAYVLGTTTGFTEYPKLVSYLPSTWNPTSRAALVTKVSNAGAVLAATVVPYDILIQTPTGTAAGIFPVAIDGTGVYFPAREINVNNSPIPFSGALPPGATGSVVPLVALNKSDLSFRYVRAAANVSEAIHPAIAADGKGSVMLLVRARANVMTSNQYVSPDACITSNALTPNSTTNPTYIVTFNAATGETRYGSFANFVAMDAYNPTSRILLKNCNLYVYSTTSGSNARYYPWTPSAFDGNGNVITGYTGPKSDKDLLLVKFGPVKLKQNTLTFAGGSTTYCLNSVVPAITGNDASLNLDIPATNQAPQCPPKVFYQWQRATSAGGPWSNVVSATGKDFAPTCTGSNTFYRRIAYCATNWLGNACKDSLVSAAIQVNCGGNVTHRTNIDPKPYAHCPGQPLVRTFAVVPGTDGVRPAYTYRWERPDNTTVASGTVAANGTSPIPASFTQDGTYYLYATDSRGCTSVDTLQLTTLSLPAASNTTLITCGAPTVKLGPLDAPSLSDDHTLSFAWSPATGLSGTNILNPTLNTAVIPSGGSATYTLTPTLDGVSCASTSVVVVNTKPAPLPALSSLTVCQGDNLTLGQGITQDPAFTYQWAPGSGIVTGNAVPTTLTTGSLAPAAVNNYTYYLTALQASSGCSVTATQNVTVYKIGNYAVAGNYPAIICPTDPNSTVSWTFGTPAEAGIGYTWTAVVSATATDAGTPTNAQAVALLSSSTASTTTFLIPTGVVFPAGGKSKLPYTIKYIRTSYNLANPSCSRTDEVIIQYVPGCGPGDVPYCQLSLPAGAEGVCAGVNTTIGPAQAANGVRYYWAPLTGLRDAVTGAPLSGTGPFSPYVKANPTSTTSYTLTGIYPSGQICSLVIKVFGATSSLPTQNFPQNAVTCAGQPITIGGPAVQGYTYLWTPPTGLSSTTLSQPTFTPDAAVSGQYIVKITDAISTCFIYDTVNVVVRTVAMPIGVGGTFCRTTGKSVTLGTAGPNNLQYSWAVIAGTATIANAGSNITTANIPAQTTNVVFQLTTTDPITGCSNVSSVTYTSVAAPTISLTTPLVSCVGGTINIGNDANDPTLTYAWTSSSAGNGLTPAEAAKRNPRVTPTGSGPWTYNVTASYNGACPATQSVTVNAAPVPTVNTVSGAPCSATGVLLSVTNAGSLSGYIYSWSPFAGVLEPPLAPASTGTTTSSIQVYPSVATSYTLTTTAPGGCVQKFVFNVPAPTYTAQARPVSICLPRTTNPTVGLSNAIPSGATVSWTTVSGYTNPTTGRISNNASATPTFLVTDNPPAGVYKYLITVNYGSGCSSTVQQEITVNTITLAAGTDKTICANTCVTIGPTANGPYTYRWQTAPNTSAGNATIDNPANFQTLVCPTGSTTYELTATDPASGCSVSDQVVVTVSPSPTLTVTESLTTCQNTQGTATVSLASAAAQSSGRVSYWLDADAQSIPVSNTAAVGAGTYYVKATTAAGCTTIRPVSVAFNALPAIAVGTPACRANSTFSVRFTVSPANATVTANLGTVQGDSVFNVPAGQTLTLTASLSGCVASTTIAAPNCCSIAAALTSATICRGQSATLIATGGSSYTFTGGTVNTTGRLVVSPLTTTTYSVTIGNASGCVSFTTGTVTVNLPPSVSATSATICAGRSGTLTASGASTYRWSTGATTASISVSVAGPYSVTGTSSAGCSATATGTLTVNPLPLATLSSATICAGRSATLTATGGTSYTFTGGTVNTTGRLVVSPSTTTTYSVTVANASGCVSTTTGTVTVNPLPVAMLSSASICVGQSATLTATGGVSYTFTGGIVTTTGTLIASPAATTTYSVTVANASGCASTTTGTVTVNPLPSVSATSATICAGQSGTLTASGATTYRWSTGATTASILVSVAGPYSVTGTSSAGCSATATATLTVNPLPVATLSSASICVGQSATLTATGGTSYTFTGGTVNTTGRLVVSPSTTTTYSVTVANASGCVSTTTGTVTVNPPPSVSATSVTVCQGQPGTLVASGAGTYRWSTGASTASISVSVAGPYSVTGTSSAGCSATAIGTLTVNPLPIVTLSSATICSGQSTTLTATGGSSYTFTGGTVNTTGRFVVNPTTTTTYSLTAISTSGCVSATTATVTVNSPPSVTATSATVCQGQLGTLTVSGASTYRWSNGATTASISVSVAGPYSVTGTSSAGCSATATGTLTVNPKPVVTLSSATICAGRSVTLIATSGTSYTFTGGTINATGRLVVSPGATTTYSVTAANASGCVSTTTGIVTVNPSPAVAITSATVCQGESATLTATGGTSYTFTGGVTNTTGKLEVSPLASTIYSVTGTSSAGCSATAAATLTVIPMPMIGVSGVAATCTGATPNNDARLTLLGSTNASRYNVSVGSSYNASAPLFATNQALPAVGGVLLGGVANPAQAPGSRYTVRVFSAEGCFRDVVVVIPPARCDCPPAKCVPIVLRKQVRP